MPCMYSEVLTILFATKKFVISIAGSAFLHVVFYSMILKALFVFMMHLETVKYNV